MVRRFQNFSKIPDIWDVQYSFSSGQLFYFKIITKLVQTFVLFCLLNFIFLLELFKLIIVGVIQLFNKLKETFSLRNGETRITIVCGSDPCVMSHYGKIKAIENKNASKSCLVELFRFENESS